MRILGLLTLVSAIAAGAGCYSSPTMYLIPDTAGHAWSGTGRIATRGASGGPAVAVGIAGKEILTSPTFASALTLGAYGPLFSEDYVVTGIAETIAVGQEEELFLHAERTGHTDTLTLFRSGGGYHPEGFMAIAPTSDAGIIDHGVNHPITRVCDLAAVETRDGDLQGGHLFASVITCTDPRHCAAGLIEVAFNLNGTPQWWVLNPAAGQQQATLNGRFNQFAGECLPIASTRHDSFATEYVAVASPTQSDLLVFTAGSLHLGPTSAVHVVKSGYTPQDVVMVRVDEATAYLSVLWKSNAAAVLEHYRVANGVISDAQPLSEPISASTQFIESPGLRIGETRVHIFSFAPEGIEDHSYDTSGP